MREQGAILVQTGEMLDNGFTISETLVFLGRTHDKRKPVFQNMLNDLQSGVPVYEVFHRQTFDHQVCTQLFFADKHGFLSSSLKEAGQFLQRKEEEKKKLLRLLQYPLLLVFALLAAGTILQTLLLPRFKPLYESMGYEPGGGMALFLTFMESMPMLLLFAGTLLAILFICCSSVLRKKSAVQMAGFYSSLPLLKHFYKLHQTAFLAREWSFLLRSGFSANEIISIMETQSFKPLLEETARDIKKLLTLGYSFSEALSVFRFIENDLIDIVAHGEKNGKLDRELLFYSNYCTKLLEEKTERAFLVLQPAIFLLIGVMVAAIYMSIFLPMFQMLESI